MTKTIKLSAVIFSAFVLSAFIYSCQSGTTKEKSANDKVEEAKKDLEDAKTNAIKVASAEEWRLFKEESESKIKENRLRIEELKLKKDRSGKTMDAVYEARIDILEKQNESMQNRMENYQKNQSDWDTFKREFNHDIDELGKSLKDFTIDNKK